MPTNSGIITAPINLTDVSSTLGIASMNVGTLCISLSINKWSKYKPVNLLNTFYAQNKKPSESGYNPSWWKGQDGNCGLEVTATGNLETVLKADWVYQRPQGGIISPFRITDFWGYNHFAVPPLKHYLKDGIVLDKAQQSVLRISTTGESSSNDNQLTINDVRVIQGTFLTANIKGLNTNFNISSVKAIQSTFDPEALVIEVPQNLFPDLGAFKCNLFFSSARYTGSNAPVATYLPYMKTAESPSEFNITVIRQSPVSITTISLSYGIYGDFKTWSEANPDFSGDPIWVLYSNGTIVFKFIVENTTSGEIEISSDQLRLHSDTFWSTREVNYGDMYNSNGTFVRKITIPPKTTINIMMEYNGALIKKNGEPTIPPPGSYEAESPFFMNSSVLYYTETGGSGTGVGTGGSGVFVGRYSGFSEWKFEVVEWV